jgi:hypothetical protein
MFNPKKCVLDVSLDKQLSYMASTQGIDANPKKLDVIEQLQPPRIRREIQKLARAISREILLRCCRRFPVLIQLWDFFLHRGLDGHVGGGRRRSNLALRTSCTLGARCSGITDDDGGLVSFTNHHSVGAGAVQGAVNEKQEDLKVLCTGL